MGVPANFVSAQGQGVITSDNLNSVTQVCTTVPVLRTFVGVANQSVFLLGQASPNDGGGGFFYWDATGTAADDNGVTTVAPTGVAPGVWTRVSFIPVQTALWALPIYIEGLPVDGEVYPVVNIPFNMTLPIGLTGSLFSAQIAATSNAVATLFRVTGGVASGIGTVTYRASGAPVISFLTSVNFLVGDQIFVGWPATHDATLSGPAMTLVFSLIP